MIERERLRDEAFNEYQSERQMVDRIIQRMIDEDMENLKNQKLK